MPYKDPEKQKAAGLKSFRKRRARNPELHLEMQRKSRRRCGRAYKCHFPSCENYRTTYRYCDTHTLKNVVGDHKLYDRVRNQLKRSVGGSKILDVPKEIFLVMLVLNNAQHEIYKMKRGKS